MKKILLCLLFLVIVVTVKAQETVIFLPIILKDSNPMAATPRLVITDGTTEIDLLGPNSGWKLADPYWNPQIATYKGGGSMVNAQLAEGQRLVHKEYGNVTETIPLSLSGLDQNKAMQTAHKALELLRQAGDYWAEPYEYDDVWIEAKIACNDCLTGYSRIIKGNIPEITNPFGQPFFSSYDKPVMENISIIFEREPFWRGTKPGEIIGPLYNLIDNPDFELWNFGVTDSQPDSWDDIETTHIVGQNSRDQSLPKFGNNDLKIRVSGSTLAGASKGVTQVINDTNDGVEYTIIAWVRSEGVSNGVGRILVTYSDQLELYRESISHGWTLYTGKITTGANDIVAIHCEILTTAANTDGTFYVDGLMFVQGDWEQEAIDGVLPYMTGSHIVNHWDQETGIIEAGDINYVDVWNIPGTSDSLIRLEFKNNSTYADNENPIEIYFKARIGMRRTQDVFKFDNYLDPVGPVDTTGSSDDRVELSLVDNNYTTAASKLIVGNDNTINNQGRFRILTRVRDKKSSGNPNLEARLVYFIGTADVNNKILDNFLAQVRDEWTIIDLTQVSAMVQDFKLLAEGPGQLGYKIQFTRDTGTDEAYFDYAIAMPTDGGYIDADINPPLLRGNALVVDNTSGQQSVNATSLNEGWNLLFTPSAFSGTQYDEPNTINYNGDIYYCYAGEVFRLAQGNPSNITNVLSVTGATDSFSSMEIYNGRLYIVRTRFVDNQWDLMRTANGTNWEIVATTAAIVNQPTPGDLKSFDGKLFIMVKNITIRPNIYTWDDTVLVHQFAGLPALDSTTNFAIYQNNLFIASSDDLWGYNPGGSWTIREAGLPGTSGSFFALTEFNNILYVASQEVISWDGTTATIVLTTTDSVFDFIRTMIVHNSILYAGGRDTGGIGAPLVFTNDGTNWTNDILTALFVRGIDSVNGSLYAITDTGELYVFSDTNVFYKVSDYKGTLFLAPPHKRHRWFFSWDRENFINNIDDKALIGIGFVPRYLTLRGKN